ncbi:MAG: SIR2 family protein [Terracidiphilus sp.]
MSDLKTALGHIKSSIRSMDDLVFLVGAGLSVSSGFDLWPKATSRALENGKKRGLSDAAYKYALEKLKTNDLYGVFGILKEELPSAAYRAIVQDTFKGANVANETQKLLVSVPCRGVITTNFDECLTAARVLVCGETPISFIPEALASKSYYIAQPHGTIRAVDSMVLTRSDWERVLREGLLRQLLEQVVSQNQLVILGYGMSDPDFSFIWSQLLRERIFTQPALFCCPTSSLDPARVAEFKSKNIQVVEFDDPDHKFAYVDEVLRSLGCPSTGPVAVPKSDAVIPKKVEDLERYVLLCMEFAPGRASRLELVCRAVILEQMISDPSPTSRPSLVSHVCRTLGESSRTITEAAEKAIIAVVEDGSAALMGELLALTDDARKSIDRKVKAAETRELEALKRVLSTLQPVIDAPLDVNVFRTLVDRSFASFGMEVAEFILYGRPSNIPTDRIDLIINDYCTPLNIGPAQRAAYADAVKRLVIQPEDDYAPVVFGKLQAYFVTSAFILNPTSERLLADYTRGHLVYLDSSIILPAIAIGHPSHPLYRSMLSSTSRLGMKLRVSEAMLNEVTHNLQTARTAFSRFGESSAEMQDILSGYMTLQGGGNGNVFIEGFAAELELDPKLSPTAYMRMVFGDGEPTECGVARMLTDRYGIERDAATEADLDAGEVARLAATIAHIRKMGNRFKTDLLCKHEAIQFALIQKRRIEQPDLFSKIWFITTDFFFVELQRLEKVKYPVPISYNPRLWLQYLDLLDHEARGSKNYSRLQHRMRYGVAVGNIGLTAIFQILKEKKDLIDRGIVTVQEMAQSVVDDYHIQHSIENYAYAHQKEGETADSYVAVKLRVRNAVGKLAVIRIQEIERLKAEKDEAIERASKAEKALAKQKYINRTARPTLTKKKGKRTR